MNTNRGLTTNNDRILKLEEEVTAMRTEQAELDSAIRDIRAALLESKEKVSR